MVVHFEHRCRRKWAWHCGILADLFQIIFLTEWLAGLWGECRWKIDFVLFGSYFSFLINDTCVGFKNISVGGGPYAEWELVRYICKFNVGAFWVVGSRMIARNYINCKISRNWFHYYYIYLLIAWQLHKDVRNRWKPQEISTILTLLAKITFVFYPYSSWKK